MTSYLSVGWYDSDQEQSLRPEVIDGAMDVAGMLLRAGVSSQRIYRIALKARSMVNLSHPTLQHSSTLGAKERDIIFGRLQAFATDSPTLDSFLADCIEHVHTTSDLFALYLHLVHITRMIMLLQAAAPSTPENNETDENKENTVL